MDFDALSRLVERLVSARNVPGASVLVLQDGREAFFRAAGLADIEARRAIARDTIFRLFSMTKPVMAAAAMALVDDGVLALDAPVTDHLPEFIELTVHGGKAADGPMTLRHLLTHTAGFSYWFYPDHPVSRLYAQDPVILRELWRVDPAAGGLEGLARTLSQLPLIGAPGYRWHYSMSFDVAGILVERAAGRSLDRFMTERIFEPLGMADTAFALDAGRAGRLASLYGPRLALRERADASEFLGTIVAAGGGGGLVSTIDDYARFAEMLRRGGEGGGGRVLSPESAQTIMTNQVREDQLAELPALAAFGLGGTGDGLGFGLGGAVALASPANGVPVFPGEYSWGGGASTTFWIDPTNRLTVVFMTQVQPPSGDMIRDQLHEAVYADLGLTGTARPQADPALA